MTVIKSVSWRVFLCTAMLVVLSLGLAPRAALGQLVLPDANAPVAPNPLTDATVKPGKMILFDLEARFAKDVLERGGPVDELVPAAVMRCIRRRNLYAVGR